MAKQVFVVKRTVGQLRFDGGVLVGRDGHEAQVLARCVQDGFLTIGIVGFERRAPDDLPAAGGGQRVDARLRAAYSDAARLDARARHGQARRVQALVEAAQVGEAGKEAQHVDEVVALGVDGDHFVFGKACQLRHVR